MYVFLTAFVLSMSQICCIGMQNALILRNGVLGRPIFWICIACGICDTIMILFGIFGIGGVIVKYGSFLRIFQLCGAIFLLCYGIKLLYNAFYTHESLDLDNVKVKSSVYAIILVSILNPQAWLDAVIIIGTFSTKYSSICDRALFALGSIFASFLWFFILGNLSKKIAHLFKKPSTWKILDLIIGIVMLFLAYKLVFH